MGDLLIEHNSLQMVDGNELLRQKIQEVLQTNKGEWFADWEHGVEFANLLGKGITEDMVRTEIENGIRQVDENMYISAFSMKTEGRKLIVNFTAANETDNSKINITAEY